MFLTVKKSSKIHQQCYRSESFARITDIHMSGPVVKNHVSFKMVFGLIVIRRTTFRSWSWVCLRLSPHQAHPQLQRHHRRKVQVQHLFQNRLIAREQMSTNGKSALRPNQKFKNHLKMKITNTNGVTRLLPKYLNGGKKSGKILLNFMEPESLSSVIHTRALPRNPLWSH